MTTEQNDPDSAKESQPEKSGGWRSKISGAMSSARNVAESARSAVENAAESARPEEGNEVGSARSVAGSAKAVAGLVGEKAKRPLDVISLAEFRTEFEQFTQAVSTAVIGVHQDQVTLGERLDRLEERLTRLEQASSGDKS